MIYLYRNNNTESAEDQIEKQALLEAMMQTRIWNEPYVEKNPFLYITPREKDFEGEKGKKLFNQFKKIFYNKYQMYHEVVEGLDIGPNIPDDETLDKIEKSIEEFDENLRVYVEENKEQLKFIY